MSPWSNRNVDESTVVLGIETSCDETAASVVMGGSDVLSSVVSTSIEQHVPFGGVVPEIASRAHVELIVPVIAQAIEEAKSHPLFVGISETLKAHIGAYDPATWRSPADAMATRFYHWEKES